MTDDPSRQDTPENEDGHPRRETDRAEESAGQGAQQPAAAVPRWSAQQPAPAPWFLGRPGSAPPPAAWAQPPGQPLPPLPPPNGEQAQWPDQAPGTRPEDGGGQSPAAGAPGTVPPWAGTPPQQQGGSPPQPPPWPDPRRHAQPGGRPPQQGPQAPFGQPARRREEPGKRPPLDLRTRWARGLAVGGVACTLLTLLNSYRNFPTWLIGAGFSLALSLTALWFGVFAQRDAAREQRRAPEAVASIVWSSISALIALSVVAFSVVCYPQLKQYSDCMRAANSIAAQQACQTQLDDSLALKS